MGILQDAFEVEKQSKAKGTEILRLLRNVRRMEELACF
jgi:hypothetical protein